MEIFMLFTIGIILVIIFTICGWCCKRKREGTVYGYAQNVTVSSQPDLPPSRFAPPYPVDLRHPLPHTNNAPAPGFSTHAPPYPMHPSNMPFPQGGMTPYPPTSVPGLNPPMGGAMYPPSGGAPYPPGGDSHPPPYDVAVGIPPIQPPPTREAYGKQAPYNPHYG